MRSLDVRPWKYDWELDLPVWSAQKTRTVKSLLNSMTLAIPYSGDTGIENAGAFPVVGGTQCPLRSCRGCNHRTLQETLEINHDVIRFCPQLMEKRLHPTECRPPMKQDNAVHIVKAVDQTLVFRLGDPVDLCIQMPPD